MLYSFFLITKNVGCSSAFRPRYPTIYYRTFFQKSERAHAAAPPLQIEPAALGFDLAFFDGNRRFCIVTRTTSEQSPLCSSSPNRSRCAGLRFGIWCVAADDISLAATIFLTEQSSPLAHSVAVLLMPESYDVDFIF